MIVHMWSLGLGCRMGKNIDNIDNNETSKFLLLWVTVLWKGFSISRNGWRAPEQKLWWITIVKPLYLRKYVYVFMIILLLFCFYLWRPIFRVGMGVTNLWCSYDRAGIYCQKCQNCRTSFVYRPYTCILYVCTILFWSMTLSLTRNVNIEVKVRFY